MVLGRVVGTVVSTAKAEQLESLKLLLVEKISIPSLAGVNDFVVALDSVGANIGEIVFYVTGSSARLTSVSKGKPSDATIAAIVDNIDLYGNMIYRKDQNLEDFL